MHMICLSMPIPASTELTEFFYISCRACLGPLHGRVCRGGSYAPEYGQLFDEPLVL